MRPTPTFTGSRTRSSNAGPAPSAASDADELPLLADKSAEGTKRRVLERPDAFSRLADLDDEPMITITCDKCGRQFRVKEELQGKLGKCPCGGTIRIPTVPQPVPAGPVSPPVGAPEKAVGTVARPQPLDWMIGQEEIKTSLSSKLAFSRANNCPLPHLLFSGPPASGKRTLATLVALALGTSAQEASAKALRKPVEALPFLTHAGDRSVLILNDIDSLAEEVIDYILPVLSDNVIRITLGEGMNTRSIEMALKRFTLIGTTPRPSRVSRRLLHWLTVCDFKSYSRTESDLIVGRMLQNARLSASEEVAALIGTCCGGSLEKASIIVKRMQNFLGVADTSTAQEKVQNLLGGGDDRDYKPLPIQSAKDILEWMGYKRDDLPSTEMACKLRSLSGTEFEEYVASVFKSLGFAVEYTPVTGDHGIDLILRRGNERAAAQCKRWEDTVGEPEVRDFLGSMVAVGVKTGYFVTTGEFSAQAMEFGERNGIRMIGLDELLSLARQGESKQPGLRQGKSPTDT